MIILHIITSLENGGAEGSLYRLVTGDKRNRHVVISLMGFGLYGEKLVCAGISVYSIGMQKNHVSLNELIKLYQIIKQVQPTCVQTWMYHADFIGGLVSRLAGVKQIYWGVRGPCDIKLTTTSTKLVIYACLMLSRILPTKIISNSIYAKNAHVGFGYPKSRMVVIPNGYSTKKIYGPTNYLRCAIREEINVPDDIFLLGMVSRFDPHKDHETLLRALKHLSSVNIKFQCVLIGPGMNSDNTALISLIRKHRVEKAIKLLGPIYDIPKIMNALDVHVLSSAAESFPNVLAEAMTSCTPCVSTDVGDARNIIGETGWIVPPGDPEALAQGIEQAFSAHKNTQMWKLRKAACRQRITEKYSLDRTIKSYSNVWARL